MIEKRYSIFDVPADLQPYAVQRPATDLLDLSWGIETVVMFFCPHCRDGWGSHWLHAEKSFREHLQGNNCRGRGASFAPISKPTHGGLKPIAAGGR